MGDVDKSLYRKKQDGPNSHKQRRGRHPDLNVAAKILGIPVRKLQKALGPPPPDLVAAARKLGIDVDKLERAMQEAGAGRH